jgi:hypothetical protein
VTTESVAHGRKFRAKRTEVVDLSIEYETALMRSRVHGLAALRRKIENRKARVPEPNAALHFGPDSTIVRAAVMKLQCHCGHGLPKGLSVRQRGVENANDSTHASLD